MRMAVQHPAMQICQVNIPIHTLTLSSLKGNRSQDAMQMSSRRGTRYLMSAALKLCQSLPDSIELIDC